MTITGKSSLSGTHYWRAWKSGKIYNGSAFVDFNTPDYAAYAIAATSAGLGNFTGTVDADTDFAELVKQSASSPAAGDSVAWILEVGSAGGTGAPTAEQNANAVWTRHGRTLDGGVRVVNETQQFEQRTIVRGNSYGSDARSLTFTRDPLAVWPADLSDGWTWTFTAKKHSTNKKTSSPESFTGTVSVTVATGDDQQMEVTLLSADITAAVGDYNIAIRGAKTGAKNWDAVLGTMRVLDSAAA